MTDVLATIAEQLADVQKTLARIEVHEQLSWPEWQSISVAAQYCSLSPVSIRRLISTGRLIAHRPIRGRVFIERRQLDDVMRGATEGVRRGRGIRQPKEPRP